jgi:hypothetical protein
MRLKMSEKRAVTTKISKRYQKSSKKEKTKILNEYVELTGYNRKHAITLLSNWGKEKIIIVENKPVKMIIGKRRKQKRSRPKKYGDDVFKPLKKIWAIYDFMCGKRLKAVLQIIVEPLIEFGEINVSKDVKNKLLSISASQIDRLLKSERKKNRIKGNSYTKPGKLLKSQIPVRTFADWNEKKPGFVEIDLVGHDGGDTRGDFCFSLNVTDVCSGWTEPVAIKNKARKWTFGGLLLACNRLPFDLLGIDSDNGSEFINANLFSYCKDNDIVFTRSRPYRKNDNCYVEEKNNSIIRRNVGYFRYDTKEEQELLNNIYKTLRLLINFFYPCMKLIKKIREGSKVRKIYDKPKTPYQRLLDSNEIEEIVKERLSVQYKQLNPAELKRELVRYQNKLIDYKKKKYLKASELNNRNNVLPA